MRPLLVCGAVLWVGCGGGGDGGGGGAGTGTTRWTKADVGLGGRASLTVTADGARDLAYLRPADPGTAVLVHAHLLPGARDYVKTDVETIAVPSFSDDQVAPAIARAADGTVVIAYQVGEPGDAPQVKVATRTGDAPFVLETVDASGYAPTLRLDGTGAPHVAYFREDAGSPYPAVATRAAGGGAWTTIDVLAGRDQANGPHLGLHVDADGTEHVAVRSLAQGKLVWATRAGGAFTTEVISDPPTDPDAGLKVIAGADGAPVVVVGDYDGLSTKTRGGDGTWTSTLAEQGRVEGPWAAAIEPSGQLVVLRGGEDQWIGTGEILRYTAEQKFQLLAESCDTDALVLTADGPLAVLDCDRPGGGGRDVYVFERAGVYSDTWESACEAAAEAICESGCPCAGSECCIDTFCTSAFGCVGNTRAHLCGDPTLAEEAVLACAPVATSGSCVDAAYQLPAACDIPQFAD